MGRSCKQEHELLSPPPAGRAASRYLRPIETVLGGHGFMKLPPLESPSAAAAAVLTTPLQHAVSGDADAAATVELVLDDLLGGLYRAGGNGITDWAMMDRLVASHLNGQAPDVADHQLGNCFDDATGADDNGGLAFSSAPANRLLIGSTGSSGGAGSDDDLWSFTRS